MGFRPSKGRSALSELASAERLVSLVILLRLEQASLMPMTWD